MAVGARGVEELRSLRCGPERGLAGRRLDRVDAVDGVRGDQAPTDRLLEGAVEDAAHLVRRSGAGVGRDRLDHRLDPHGRDLGDLELAEARARLVDVGTVELERARLDL